MPILDISQRAASLRMEGGRLRVDTRDGKPANALALVDLEAVILGNPQIHLTHAVLAQLAVASVPLVVCDSHYQPVGLLVPLVGNAVQTERIRTQALVGEPRRKQLWKQIVQAKLRNQGSVIEEVTGDDLGLRAFARQVTSGDASNREAQGARRYWPALFGAEFRRNQKGEGPNGLLNYGYALLRSLAARSVVGAGLHPSLGLQHHNRYDALALASDLMEPYRPWVDIRVHAWLKDHGTNVEPTSKANLYGLFEDTVSLNGERWSLGDALHRSAARLTQALGNGRLRLLLPER